MTGEPRKRLLDLFCGAGGAAMGYYDAGFDVVGVDINPQPHYPGLFIEADALKFLRDGRSYGYDVIHASPPCQHYTDGRRAQRKAGLNPYPDLIAPARELLIELGQPWVIENVPGAPLLNPIRLCGQQFGLRVIRHRLFESSELLLAPPHPKHVGSMLDGSIVAVYGRKWLVSGGARKGEAGYHTYGRIPPEFRRLEARQAAMGIDWMTGDELNEAIPPAYTEYIGRQLLASLAASRVEEVA